MAWNDFFFLTQKYPWGPLRAPCCRSQGSGGHPPGPVGTCPSHVAGQAPVVPLSHMRSQQAQIRPGSPLYKHIPVCIHPWPTDRALQTTQQNQPGKSPQFWPQELHQCVSLSLRRQLCPQNIQRQLPLPGQVAWTHCIVFAHQGTGTKQKANTWCR